MARLATTAEVLAATESLGEEVTLEKLNEFRLLVALADCGECAPDELVDFRSER